MAFQGFEAGRGTLKCRCPAAAFGLDCKGRAACYKQAGCQVGEYGRVVRIDLGKVDRRIFNLTPHGSSSWRRGHKRRAALERINGRLDDDFGFERHYIRGGAAMIARVGLALAIMMVLALGHMLERRPGQMRSLVGPVPFLDTGYSPERRSAHRPIILRPPAGDRPRPSGAFKRQSFSFGRKLKSIFSRTARLDASSRPRRTDSGSAQGTDYGQKMPQRKCLDKAQSVCVYYIRYDITLGSTLAATSGSPVEVVSEDSSWTEARQRTKAGSNVAVNVSSSRRWERSVRTIGSTHTTGA